MALTTSMPLLGDLTMKFSRHSLHDPFQLPSSYNFYHCFEQAKDIALYNRFFASRDEHKIFQFTGSSGEEHYSSSEDEDDEELSELQNSRIPVDEERTDPIHTKVTAYANPTQSLTCPTGRTLSEITREDEEALCSDEEELASYFSAGKHELCGGSTERETRRSAAKEKKSPNRKRSIELDESVDVKRCRRPRLNFEKMQLQRGDDCTSGSENGTNYFRPISLLDL